MRSLEDAIHNLRKHYTGTGKCCNASELSLASNLRCPCCGYLATKLSPQMLEDLHRTIANKAKKSA